MIENKKQHFYCTFTFKKADRINLNQQNEECVEMDDFGIKIHGKRKDNRPKPETKIYKLNGEELTEWDLKFLYTRGEKLNYEQIAEVFNVDPKVVSRYAWFFGIIPRWQDKELRNQWSREKDEQEKKEREKKIIKSVKRNLDLANIKRPEVIEINGKEYVDAFEQRDYKEKYQEEVERVESPEIYNKHIQADISELRNVHLIAMRAYRKLDRFAFSRKSGLGYQDVRFFELNPQAVIPKRIEQIYIDALRISKRELRKLVDVLAGKRDLTEEEDREIPLFIKHKVWTRDKGKCTSCGRTDHLHYHHIKKFSDGGMHTFENLKLLCVSCHAEEHKEDRSYHLLKSMAEKLLGVTIDG